jgi:hypothetical protein
MLGYRMGWVLVGFLIGTRLIPSSSLYATEYSVIWIFVQNLLSYFRLSLTNPMER